MSNGNSWSARLAALDAASLRLADKTRSLNDLLRDLQHGGAPAGGAAAAAAASAAASARSSPLTAMARPLLSSHAAALPTMVLPASSVSRANEQITRVQQWLAQLNGILQKAPNDAAPPPQQAASALDTLARMQAMVAASDLSTPPSPVVKPQSNGFLSPPGAALPADHSAPSASSSATSSSANAANAKRSVKGTIQPLQPLGGGAQMGLAGVHVPPGTVFVDGKWQRVRASPSQGSAGGKGSPSHAGQADSEDEADPFADFSDHDASLPGTPRRGSLLEQKVAPSPPLGSFRSSKKNSPSINTLKRRGEGEKDIGEEDVAEFENREAAAASGGGAGGARVPKSPSVVLEDGQWLHTDTVREEEEADIFADIEDLEVNPAEEERRRAAELARSSSSASSSAAATLAPSPTSRVKSAAEVSARAKAIRNKTSTLRKDLFKHMGQDVEIDEGDVASLLEEEEDEQQAEAAAAAAAAAGVPASPSPASPAMAGGAAAADEDEFDVDAELESPRPAAHVFKPDLEATKAAAGVTELNTRKEGQEQEADEWNDVELKREHLRKASTSALKQADDRPDDLDGLSDDDEDEQPARPIIVASSPASRNGVPSGTVTHLHTPSSKSFGGSGGRHSAAASSSSFGGAFEDDDFSDLDHSRLTFSGGSASKSNRTMHHSHSASASSVQSVQSNHGQLSAQLSDDDADDLDDMLDEDEQAQSSIKVDVSRSQADRASRKLDEFDLSRVSTVFSESESSRSRFLGSTDLHSLSVLQRPVDEQWMMELAAQCRPPTQLSDELPHLQHSAAALSSSLAQSDPAVPLTPEKSDPADAAAAADSTPGAASSASGSHSKSSGGSNNKKNRKGKNKQSR